MAVPDTPSPNQAPGDASGSLASGITDHCTKERVTDRLSDPTVWLHKPGVATWLSHFHTVEQLTAQIATCVHEQRWTQVLPSIEAQERALQDLLPVPQGVVNLLGITQVTRCIQRLSEDVRETLAQLTAQREQLRVSLNELASAQQNIRRLSKAYL